MKTGENMKRILVIDDDEKIRTLFKRFLGGKGYDVLCAENGKEGLQLLEAETLDLVITDIMMPEKDGLEVVLAMRLNHADIPIIAISGGMQAAPLDFLPMAHKFGAKKVLYKPVELKELLAAVKEALGN